MVGGQYLILFSSLALLVISAHIPGGRAQADATSGDNRQLSSSQQTISREKRGVGLTSTGFGVMATGLVSLLSLSLSPELRRRVSNLEQLARAGPAPGAWSRRFSRGRARGQRPQRQGPTQCVYRLGATCVYSVPVRRL